MRNSPAQFGLAVSAALFLSLQTLPAQPAIRPPTHPGTPALVPAGPNAEALAKAALTKAPAPGDAAANPTEAAPGANPPASVDGNFLIGPAYVRAPELTENTNTPHGKVSQFTMNSVDSKFYPGIGRKAFGTVDPNNPKTLIVETHPAPYQRAITVLRAGPIRPRRRRALHGHARRPPRWATRTRRCRAFWTT